MVEELYPDRPDGRHARGRRRAGARARDQLGRHRRRRRRVPHTIHPFVGAGIATYFLQRRNATPRTFGLDPDGFALTIGLKKYF